MRLVPERERWLPEIAAQIPQLELVCDVTRNPLDTFLLAMLTIGADAAVHVEDDIVLTSHFLEKIEAEISSRPNILQQFFSLRKTDTELGSRLMPGRTFCMAQCFYLPAGYAEAVYDYYPSWPGRVVHGNSGSDLIVAGLLASRREKYWLHVPSLVQHRVARSAADPRRSSKRQSMSFRP